MKDLSVKCFRRRVMCYGGQVGFTKLDFAEIPRITKSAFAVDYRAKF